jgi:hypothetical protein
VKKTRILSFAGVIYFIFLVLVFSSCAKENKTDANQVTEDKLSATDQNNSAVENGEKQNEAAAEQFPYPEADFGGYEFRMLVPGPDTGFWYNDEMYAAEENGDPINDAIYKRVKEVESMYNIKLVNIESQGDKAGLARKSILSGTNAYDMLLMEMGGGNVQTLASEGHLVNLHTVFSLNLNKPWWDQKCVEGMSLVGKLFNATGEISYFRYRTTEIILFNKKMLREFALEDPYQLVKDKKWTIDKMIEMMKGVAQDLDGDGKMTKEDRFGIVVYTSVISTGMFGAGELMSKKNSEDIPELVMNNERLISVVDNYFEFVLDSNIAFDWARLGGDRPFDVGLQIFEQDRALFDFNGMHAVPNLRQMDTDFGILPIPLYEEKQTSYGHIANSYVTPFVCIPADSADIERTGIIIDAMARKGMEHITPAYYDVSLKGKFARDDESQEILDLVFSTLVYDICFYYDFGGIGKILDTMVNAKKTDFSSAYEKIENKVKLEIEKYVDLYRQLP